MRDVTKYSNYKGPKIGYSSHKGFEHFLNNEDEAVVFLTRVEDGQCKREFAFVFDRNARMFNKNGTPVGMISMVPNSAGQQWEFFSIEQLNDRLITTKVMDLNGDCPFHCEPEIINWLIQSGNVEGYLTK